MLFQDEKTKSIFFNAIFAVICLGDSAACAAGTPTGATAPTAEQREYPPRQVVSNLNAALLLSMKTGPSGAYRQRFHILYPAIKSAFDFPRIARLTLGTSWTRLNPSQQHQFVQTLTKYSAANYATRFDHYAGQEFTLSSPKMPVGGRAIVTSNLIAKDGSKDQFVYLLGKSGGRWRIVNVVTDGVSALAMEKTEFTAVLKKEGFGALLAGLNAHASNLAHGYK
ncbi:ABC transporter substrate-binding protein [Acidithiobacillus sp. MC6.1]|nr:ABC transporter substrate-binding protein [Acidithiobacillus sp. MC6.1]